MSTLLFCTSYVRDLQAWNERYSRWIGYYREHNLGANQLLLIDDGSPYVPKDLLPCLNAETELDQAQHPVQLLRFDDRLGRGARLSYPGWWRSFTHSVKVARAVGAKKLIHVESDAFVLSARLRQYIESLDSGWTVLWSHFYNMPETAIQVICEDQFDALAEFGDGHWNAFEGRLAEEVLPFTHVSREFIGDRYSEMKRHRGFLRSRKFDGLFVRTWDNFWQPVPANADFVAQVVEMQWLHSRSLHAALAA
ncbi:hypothetical protein ACFJGW_20530 [Burkholderiaceae bacterium UC74_6]